MPAPSSSESVKQFYDTQPFNRFGDLAAQADLIKSLNQVAAAYPDLDRWLRARAPAEFVDLGSGCGWLSSTLEHHYGWLGQGIDLSSAATTRAKELAQKIGLRSSFREADLFAAATVKRPLVVSIGVLHHTGRWREALASAARWLAPGPDSLLYVGLYHRPGRTAFLEQARIWRSLPPDEGLRSFAQTFAQGDDPGLIHSWFLDQVHHPEETQVTFAEVVETGAAIGLKPLSTSLFGAWEKLDVPSVIERESEYAAIGRSRIDAKQFFPGFFTVALGHSR